ncbi:MAG TPA: DUF4080 domain-containing protein [Tepidisphaeraceae bacterium]|nr:DUF4080 domain-containing protein [Tepidisphaeraceae bacterium]
MPDILLATLNAKYAHAAFGLRYLMANLPPALAARATMLEFDIAQRPIDIVEQILSHNPRVVGLGVYIWNAEQSTKLAADLKRLRPDLTLILGGPEISYETHDQEVARHADYIITGEADLAFADLCAKLLAGRRPLQKVIAADLPEFEEKGSGFRVQGSARTDERSAIRDPQSAIPQDSALRTQHSHQNPEPRTLNPLRLPYGLYSDHDLAHRVVYVEASRGCPFKCEFCLSSLDVPVRNVPTDAFVAAMQDLLDRGLRQFKFVDRTFNLNLKISRAILEFFLARYTPGLFLHFEMIPDRLPEPLRELIAQFPPGALQFEVGIQTFNPLVCEVISRRQDTAKLEDNLRWLRAHTGVHVHADLIVGLPGEDVAGFATGFDRLVRLRPQEIQVGILKRLRGTPIVRHDAEWQMVYSPSAPYEVLQTKLIDFATMQRMRRFARYWDTIANSGNFRETTDLLLGLTDSATGEGEPPSEPRGTPARETNGSDGASPSRYDAPSPFHRFLTLSDSLHARFSRAHGISLQDLAEHLFTHLTAALAIPPEAAARALWADYQRTGRSDRPAFLRPHIAHLPIPRPTRGGADAGIPRRQARHLA